MTATAHAIDVLAIGATVAGTLLARARSSDYSMGRSGNRSGGGRFTDEAGGTARRWTGRPGFWFALVVAAVFVNQVLFTAYVLRVHGGDVSFAARYVPSGWFAVDHGDLTRVVAAAVPAPHLLSFTVFRAQAALELPLVLLAYLTTARWLSPSVYRRLTSPAVLAMASAAYTLVFCVIEVDLRNPWTTGDIVIRVASGLITPLLLARLGRIGATPDGPPVTTVAGLLLFAVSAGALGAIVLVVYDTALLYNLGHLRADAPAAVCALAVVAGSRALAARTATAAETVPRPGAGDGGPVTRTSAGLGTFLLATWLEVFFVPALPVRYALGFGTRTIAVLAGAGTMAAAVIVVRRRVPVPAAIWTRLATAVGAGILAGLGSLVLLPRTGYPEARLLLVAVLSVAVVTAVCAAMDRVIVAET